MLTTLYPSREKGHVLSLEPSNSVQLCQLSTEPREADLCGMVGGHRHNVLCGFNESYVANTSEEYTARTISFTTLC